MYVLSIIVALVFTVYGSLWPYPFTSHRPYPLYIHSMNLERNFHIILVPYFLYLVCVYSYHCFVLPCLCYLHVIYCRAIALVANVAC